MNLVTCLWVMAGGAIGTLARFLIANLMLPYSDKLPVATIAINITGSFVIGFAGTLTLAHGKFPLSETMRLFIMVGLCGGYTTFSAFSLQTFDLMRSGAFARASINVSASVLLCILAVALGHWSAAKLNGGARVVAQIAIEEEA